MNTIARAPAWVAIPVAVLAARADALELHVAPDGDDGNPGTRERPLATLGRARDIARERRARAQARWEAGHHEEPAAPIAAILAVPRSERSPQQREALRRYFLEKVWGEAVTIRLRGGIYYLREPLVLGPEDGGSRRAPVAYAACAGERPVLSGAVRLALTWSPYRDGILKARIPRVGKEGLVFTRLFADGRLLPLARYPNEVPGDPRYNGPGSRADATSPERVRRWSRPAGGLVHGLSSHRWGSLHYRIAGVDARGRLELEGGDQINRRASLHREYRFVENIFEELDAPGEWYLDREAGVLYLLPPEGFDPKAARLEAVRRKLLIVLRGSRETPVRWVRIRGLTFTETARTCFDPYEPLRRGDWSIVRAGAVFIEGAEDCALEDCAFEGIGGNGVFISRYNRRVRVEGCRFVGAGESAVCLVGDPAAVRSPSTWEHPVKDPPDRRIGPATPDYPAHCVVHDNLIHDIGVVGKQTAGVFISMASQIIVGHNTIYRVPRAGICINDGCWGGHIIEHNHVFDTVRETGDHGPFNAWGRDRHWGAEPGRERSLALLDNFRPTIIRYNRFEHRGGHSWGIDLDDGSSNYQLTRNLCLGMSFKLREGFFRLVENNIAVGPTPPGFHVWYRGCGDTIRRNIIVNTKGTAIYAFIRCDPAEASLFDENCFYNEQGEATVSGIRGARSFRQWQAMGFDVHSVFADPRFRDPARGDFRVRADSPALKLGFENFPMDRFGVLDPSFRAEAQAAYRKLPPVGRGFGTASTPDPAPGIRSDATTGA